MAENVKRVLFVNSEMCPYLPESDIATIARQLPQSIQEKKKEIRSFMPRYGFINERKNQLHEVIRLSGMNIIISDVDHPLIIKVASISSARIQVYFIDNEDYFRRRQMFSDASGKFFPDNDERAIFFARGVLETTKKLRWAPDIIHCQGWISHLVPAYLKKAYRDDPIFSSSKVVLSLYDDLPDGKFSSDFAKKAEFGGLHREDLPHLEGTPGGVELAKTAISYADGLIFGSASVDAGLAAFGKSLGLPALAFDAKALADGSYTEAYNAFYDSI